MNFTVKYWQMASAESAEINLFERVLCPGDDGEGWPCSYYPHFVLSWTVNTSGLPALGEPRYDYACYHHLAQRIGLVPFDHAGSVVVTPYKAEEVQK